MQPGLQLLHYSAQLHPLCSSDCKYGSLDYLLDSHVGKYICAPIAMIAVLICHGAPETRRGSEHFLRRGKQKTLDQVPLPS